MFPRFLFSVAVAVVAVVAICCFARCWNGCIVLLHLVVGGSCGAYVRIIVLCVCVCVFVLYFDLCLSNVLLEWAWLCV